MAIYKSNPNKAIEILEHSLQLNKSQNEEYAISKNYLGIIYRDLGEFEKSKKLSEEVLSITKDSLSIASAYNNIGAVNRQLGLFEDALQFYLKALTIYEAQKFDKYIAVTLDNIGVVYNALGFVDKAIKYHLEAKDTFERINDKKGISKVYNNIAMIYANDGELEKALDYFKYSLDIEKKLDDKKGIAESANNLGAVYYYLKEIDSALYYFNESANIEKSIGNYAGVGASYNNIAQVLIENKRVSEAKTYIDSAYFYAKESKAVYDIEASLLNYSDYYEAKKDTKSAFEYFKEYTKHRDSILNVETNNKIAELEVEYQTEKKEKEIITQRAEIAEKELNLNRKNTQLIGLSLVAVLLTVLGYLFYNQQKLKNRQLQKESELKEALVKIETQNRLQDQRLRISRDLHDNIGAQLTFIISSIENLQYGFKITNDKLNSKLIGISSFTKDTINELRDTIWAMNKNEISLDDLEVRISNFVKKANVHSEKTSFKFEIDDAISKVITFTSVEGMNIYRIVQEAINNAVKYAEAKNISVQISKKDKVLLVTINDDGKGFDKDEVKLGNGLSNMRKRAQEIGADFNIESKIESGTSIKLNIDLS